jgi:hypothetical protein
VFSAPVATDRLAAGMAGIGLGSSSIAHLPSLDPRRGAGRRRAGAPRPAVCCSVAALLIVSRGLGSGRGDEARAMAALPAAACVLGGQRMRGVPPGARQQRTAGSMPCGGCVRPTLALRGGSNSEADDDDDAALRAAILEAQQETAAAEARAGGGHGQEHSQAGGGSAVGGVQRVWRTARGVALPDDPQGVCARALQRGAPLASGRRERRGA